MIETPSVALKPAAKMKSQTKGRTKDAKKRLFC
jgi:hypothetical protein